jgi:hypothetical protein
MQVLAHGLTASVSLAYGEYMNRAEALFAKIYVKLLNSIKVEKKGVLNLMVGNRKWTFLACPFCKRAKRVCENAKKK